ncbi:MAG: hypothetical protein K1X88_00755 [Nannocystaceae bacterium]|nr:hypothetical protein [Nannocystaceae bacterium]
MVDRDDEVRPLRSPYWDAYARAIEPDASDAARVQRALQRRLAARAREQEAPAPQQPRAAAAFVLLLKSTALSVGIAATALGGLAVAARTWAPVPATLPATPAAARASADAAPSVAPVPATPPITTAPVTAAEPVPQTIPVATPASAPRRTSEPRAERTTEVATTPAADDALRAELELIERARAALGRGDETDARRSLERHAREHSRGVLQIERDGWLAVLDCRDGRSDAITRGRSFVATHPRSGLRDDVITACALDRNPGTNVATDSAATTE